MGASMALPCNEATPEHDERDAEALVLKIAQGNDRAREELFAIHRPRLCRVVRARIGRDNLARDDPSDIVQKALAVAFQRLDQYLRDRPMPFFPWLYVLTRDQLQWAAASRLPVRSIQWSDRSAARLADHLIDSGTTPRGQAIRKERHRKVRHAVARLKADHREVLVMNYDEGLKLTEVNAILRISEGAARMRHLRTLEELKRLLGPFEEGYRQ
jgi:RNA polymerase sigma-70 factor (ECF subfamily)